MPAKGSWDKYVAVVTKPSWDTLLIFSDGDSMNRHLEGRNRSEYAIAYTYKSDWRKIFQVKRGETRYFE